MNKWELLLLLNPTVLISPSMMENFCQEETIRNAKIVSGTVSNLLESMATQFHNQMSSNPQLVYKVTVFDLNTVPDIQLSDYIFRMMTMSKCIYRDLIAALIYIDNLINKGVISGISYHNMHRLLAFSIMTSMKFFDDVHYSNASWSKIAGIPLRELNNVEIEFLQALNFDLNIPIETMQVWSESIAQFADENPVLNGEPESQEPEVQTQPSSDSAQETHESNDSAIIL